MLLLVSAIAVAAQPGNSSSTPKTTIAFQCQQLPILTGEGSQTYRLECWSGDFPVGRTAEGLFNWTAGMTRNTRIKSVQLTLLRQPVDVAKGTDHVSLLGSFTAGRSNLPVCATKQRYALKSSQTVTTPLTLAKFWNGQWSCSGPKLSALAPADGSSTKSATADATVAVAATSGPAARAPTTPDGLRLRLGCLTRSSGGRCSAMVRLQVQFVNSTLPNNINVFEQLSQQMEEDEGFKCDVRSWKDDAGLLGLKNATISTEVCYPPATSTGNTTQRQAAAVPAGTPVRQTLDMAYVIPYEPPIMQKATRFAMYAGAFHGCLPSLPDSPERYKADDGSYPERQWDGPNGMSSWGGPGNNFGQPGPECLSCFKGGISFDDTPKGFQTPEHDDVTHPDSFLDAAIVFTDTVISGVDGQAAVVVLFRATATDIQASQWISNIGRCIAGAFIRTSPTGDPASGNVCNGWNTPVEDLIGLNLLVEVKRRLWTLPEEHRTVYVVGHSRGGALASVFAAKLLGAQATGELPPYSGDPKDQVKLYTFGSPRVGDTVFAAYLENNMNERYRIITRYDAVPTLPGEIQGYSHYRPSIWYRDSTNNTSGSATKGCVLFDQDVIDDLPDGTERCFIPCKLALTCTYGAGVDTLGKPSSTLQECDDLTATRQITAAITTKLIGGVTLIDHASYLGIDVDNAGCREDMAFIDAFRVERGLFLDTCVVRGPRL
ncbi:hypothetical protein OEZ86_012625 [Tetradesmus obliquus]|nr:hypothetical protein OEZ86_012625 [Tetradesmus obliquus]